MDSPSEAPADVQSPGPPDAPRRPRPPRTVWLACAALALIAALWTVAVPAYRAPDEAAHTDLVLYLADGNGYPRFDGRRFGEEIGLDTERHLVELTEPWPRFDAADAPDRTDRPDVEDLGGLQPDAEARQSGDEDNAGHPYVYNQMPQHPPLYYETMAGLLRVERWLLPGDGLPALDRELGILRLANVLLLAPLPLLAWATVRRLGGDDRAGATAALLPLCLPQLVHIGAALNNDNLLILLGSVLAVLLAGIGRGRTGVRTDLAVGAVLGLALLTKAFAVMFVPWVVGAYLLAAATTRRWGPAALRTLTAVGLGAVVGGWWWVANWIREGEPAPTTESLTRTVADRPRGFTPDPVEFAWTFSGRLIARTWAWVGFGTPKFDLPTAIVVVGTLAFLAVSAVAIVSARRGVAPAPGLRRVDAALAWVPVVLVTAFVARRAWGLYDTTGHFAFIQGRYLFGTLVGAAAVAAIGATRVHRRAPVAVLATAALVQGWVLRDVVAGAWSGEGGVGPIDGLLAWSPWPEPAVITVAAAVALVTGALAWETWRASRPAQPSCC